MQRSPHGFGRRAQLPGVRRVAGAVLLPMGVLLAGPGMLVACGSSHRAGGLPAFLPKATVPVDRVVSASPGRPQLAVQGATVSVSLPGARLLATVAGPAVPPFVAPPPPAVTATFTVTLARATAPVAIALGDFTIRDQFGRLVHPEVPTGQAPLPDAIPAGGNVTFQLAAVLPVGEGVLRWAPGGTPVVSWDFVVEDD